MAEVASAFVSIAPSARGFRSKLDSQIGGDVEKSGKKSGISFGKIFAVGAALGVGAKGISFLGDSLAEGRDAQKVSALVENAIKATGGAANVTAKQVDRLSSSISKKTGIDDEQIAKASSLILTFKNVANEGKGVDAIFNRTTKAAVDLSAAGFGSVDSTAKQLGKALNDPIKGMSALSRSGVTFTEGQQKQIKGFVETGNLLKAQKVILGEVNSQVGGAAAATATESEKATVAAGNLKEQIGTALIPLVDSLASTFTSKVAPAISGFVTGMTNGTGAGGQFVSIFTTIGTVATSTAGFIDRNKTALAALATVIGTVVAITKVHAAVMAIQSAGGFAAMLKGTKLVSAATKAYAAIQWVLNAALTANPIGIVVVALVALGAGLVIAYKKSETFRRIVDGAFAGVKSIAQTVADFVTKTVPAAFSDAASKVSKSWESVKDGARSALDFIKTIPDRILSVFDDLAGKMSAAGGKLMAMLASGIKAAVLKPYNELKAAADKLKSLLPGSPIKEGPLKPWNDGTPGVMLMDFLAKGIAKGGKKTREAMTKELDKLKGNLTTLKSDFTSLAESVSGAFAGDLFGVQAIVADSEAGVAGKTVGQNFIDSLMSKKGELTSLLASFKTLKGWGVPASFLSQLFASGNGALITELAGMGQAGAVGAASLFSDVTNLGAQLGGAVAANDFGANIDKTTSEIKELRKDIKELPKKQGKETADALKNVRFVVEGEGAGRRAYLRTGK